MRAICFSLVGMVLVCGAISGQECDCFQLGFKAGITHSQYLIATENQPPSDVMSFKPRIGYYLGLTTNFRISQRIKWQPELFLAIHGSTVHISGVDDDLRTIDELTISFPLMLRVQVFDRFHLVGGPQFGYIFDQPNKIRVAVVRDLGNFAIDRLDFGLAVGAGYQIKQKWEVSARYFQGLIERDNFVTSSVINIGLGYWL